MLVGHTFDDVIETALIRRRRGVRGASIVGPALAAPAPTWPEGRGITILRPLIHASRDSLRAHLLERAWEWCEDPSNEARSYERVRVRQFLKRHPALHDLSAQFVRKLQHERTQEDQSIGASLSRVQVTRDGLIDTGNAEISPRLLGLLARCASGGDTDPRARATAALIKALEAPGMRQTLGGAWFQKTATGFLIGRDPSPSTPSQGSEIHDGRFARSDDPDIPPSEEQAFLVRHAAPAGQNWREIISERLMHMSLCFRTKGLKPIAS